MQVGRREKYYTPLHFAAAGGYLQDLELMLASVPSEEAASIPLALNSKDRTPLWFAAANGHIDAVKLLLRLGAKAHINHLTRQPQYPTTLWAMVNAKPPNSLEGITALLISGADPNIQQPTTGQTLLHHAALTNNTPLLTLLQHNANPHLPGNTSALPLHHPAYYGYLPCVTALLQPFPHHPPLDINTPNNAGSTLLLLAARFGYDFLLPLLLAHKADPHHRDISGLTFLFGHEAVVQLLLDKGAAVDAKEDSTGRKPLSYAARYGREAVVQLLLDKGADVDAKDDSSETPLSWVATTGHETIVRQLLDKDADVDAKDDSGWTPLFYAAARGHEAVVRQLLDNDADVEAKDGSGRTPLFYAAVRGHEAVVRLLKS
ncbi:ankyrin repeat-containing domain protein [Parachaetomium inaequale]|uniref:Ankyrin repeat-containing domain protein n=1 Tax=Parachaetomium inaequale TaxID=2588326 RepID=A0AAN6P423_9PEZI|nr:ankyrin repeat-containing domain protein [Parachaetomium inaequale]